VLGESQLNVYILGADLTPRQRERIQAQVQAALRSLPPWAFQLVTERIETLGVRNLPLIVEPQTDDSASARVMSMGHIEGRPAVRLMPRLRQSNVDWGQDQRYLIAKAVAYLAAPAAADVGFWSRWSDAVQSDQLGDQARSIEERWRGATDLDLLVEMFAAYALNPVHSHWSDLPSVKQFLDEWRQT
jgi:hypothetical protein